VAHPQLIDVSAKDKQKQYPHADRAHPPSMLVGNANFSNALNSTNSPITPEPSNIWPIVRFLLAALILAGLVYFFRYR